MKKNHEFLDQINFPSDLKKVPESKLQKVANELREGGKKDKTLSSHQKYLLRKIDQFLEKSLTL